MLVAVAGEEIVRHETRGRWEYVKDTQTGWRGYLHMDCDALTTNEGYCVMCGAPCPTMWTA